MDIIYLRGLRVETTIGVYEWERRIRQLVIIDIEMAIDSQSAAATDSIEEAVNYSAVAESVIKFADGCEYKLLETLACRLAEMLIAEFHVPWLRLQLNKKGAVREAKDVGIIIERGRRQ